jgi:hypothetical protein
MTTQRGENPWLFRRRNRRARRGWRRRNTLIGQRSSFVVSVLHRMGVEATVSFSQSDNVDITVIHESGRVLTVDVKTLSGTKEWAVSPFRAASHHYLVFVWYAPDGKPSSQPIVYVVASERLHLLARKRTQSLSLDVLARELSAQDAWQELIVAPAA